MTFLTFWPVYFTLNSHNKEGPDPDGPGPLAQLVGRIERKGFLLQFLFHQNEFLYLRNFAGLQTVEIHAAGNWTLKVITAIPGD